MIDAMRPSPVLAALYLDLVREAVGAGTSSVTKPLDRLSQLVNLSIDEVRSTLQELRPPLLEAQGLAASLRIELGDLRGDSDGTDVEFVVDRGCRGAALA